GGPGAHARLAAALDAPAHRHPQAPPGLRPRLLRAAGARQPQGALLPAPPRGPGAARAREPVALRAAVHAGPAGVRGLDAGRALRREPVPRHHRVAVPDEPGRPRLPVVPAGEALSAAGAPGPGA